MTSFDKLADWYTHLTPETLAHIGQYYASNARFKDPFNEVQGIAAIRGVFEHMFATTEQPRFVIRDRLADGEQAFVTWDFKFGVRVAGRTHRLSVHGATRFVFDAHGKVLMHRDYWDAAEELWQQLPVLGGATRWLRRRFAARP